MNKKFNNTLVLTNSQEESKIIVKELESLGYKNLRKYDGNSYTGKNDIGSNSKVFYGINDNQIDCQALNEQERKETKLRLISFELFQKELKNINLIGPKKKLIL